MPTLLLALGLSASAFAVEPPPERAREAKTTKDRTVAHKVVFWIPNRLLDAVDIVRARARVGPGVAVNVRATEYADAHVGLYAAGYLGLPGPRNRRIPKLPFGIESKNGVEVSKADLYEDFHGKQDKDE